MVVPVRNTFQTSSDLLELELLQFQKPGSAQAHIRSTTTMAICGVIIVIAAATRQSTTGYTLITRSWIYHSILVVVSRDQIYSLPRSKFNR